MRLYYEAVSNAWAMERDPYTITWDDIVKGLQQVDQVHESPMGIVSLKPLSYWELKVLDLKEAVKGCRNLLFWDEKPKMCVKCVCYFCDSQGFLLYFYWRYI